VRDEPVLVIGHRGAPGYRPEHTRSSYRLALDSGVDAVEPDIVLAKDGTLVVRHENEISGTTDVASRSEFAARRRTATVDGVRVTGWFTEDFTWDELATLRCRERIPDLRRGSARYDGREPMLRLRDVLHLAATADRGVVLEIKHATYFAGLGWDVAAMIADELRAAGWTDRARPLVIESFEPTVLSAVRERDVAAQYILLLEASGAPADLVRTQGADAPGFAWFASREGLDALAGAVDGISVDKRMLLTDRRGPSAIVDDAHARGLRVFTWTCRPENAFLTRAFRQGAGKAAFGDYAGEWGMLRDAGVDGVFVDHPDLGVRVFR
jgi:glycerophosphoryl diester phosphodiesterase